MKKFLLIFLAIFAFGDEILTPKKMDEINPVLILESAYETSDGIITARTFFPNLHINFQVAVLPIDKFEIELKSEEVIRQFGRHKIKLEAKDSVIKVRYKTDMRYKKEEEFLKKEYINFYKNNEIKIEKILLKPAAKIAPNLELKKINLGKKIYSNKGQIIAIYGQKKTQSVSFYYEILGEIAVFKARENLSVNENLSAKNTQKIWLNLAEIRGEYLGENELDLVAAKSYISKDSIISKNKTKSKILVKKGENVVAKLKEENLNLEVNLVAKQSGAHGEVINAQNVESGKILRVKITGQNKGEVL